MRNGLLSLVLFAAAIGSGCGGGTPVVSTLAPTSSLHGGILIALPEDLGYVKLLNGNRERRGYAVLTTIVAYLLQPDQKSALSQQARSITVKLGAAPTEQAVALRPDPDRTDPVGSARYVSEPGSFYLEQSGGEIIVVLDGKTLKAPFRGPR